MPVSENVDRDSPSRIDIVHPVRQLLALTLALALTACSTPTTRWYKGNLHTHTLWSDGNDFPEMVVDWYRTRGYDFLALSDHNIIADHEKWMVNDKIITRGGRSALARYRRRFGEDWVETRLGEDGKLEVRLKCLDEFRPLFEEPEEFLLITAEEITDSFGKLPIHINATNVREKIAPRGGKSVRDVIRRNLAAIAAQAELNGSPILAHLNHPNYGWAVTAEDLAAVPEERFFEVYNGHPGVRHRGDATHASVERMWDIANTIRISEFGAAPLLGLATDDCHNYFNAMGSTPGRGWVMVRACELCPEALIEALEAGDFYASSGVTLRDVSFDGSELSLEIVADGDATFVTEFIGTRAEFDGSSEPMCDGSGRPVRATREYSSDVGAVLARVEGCRASYRLEGDELFVRAVVTASVAPENPAFDGQKKQAWTQPVRP